MSSPSLLGHVREIPLGTILGHFGLMPRREGATTRYKNDQYNIVVSPNNLWFDNAAAIGGRGAIDLTLHLKYRTSPRGASDHDLREAINWLAAFQPGTGPVTEAAPSQKRMPPKEIFAGQTARYAMRDDGRWPIVQHYLTHARRLPGELVHNLYVNSDIYPSFSQDYPERTGVCFVHRNLEGEVRGATIRNASAGPGSTFSIGEKAGAWFTLGDPNRANQAILVESPIDAVSYVAMKRPDQAVVLSMSCANVFRSVLQAAHDRGWSLAVGLNNDKAGYTGWERCEENQRLLYPNDPPAIRIRPAANDWNDDLCAAARRSHGRSL